MSQTTLVPLERVTDHVSGGLCQGDGDDGMVVAHVKELLDMLGFPPRLMERNNE